VNDRERNYGEPNDRDLEKAPSPTTVYEEEYTT